MDCGGVIVKYILYIFNTLISICGILLIVFGSLLIANMEDFKSHEKTWEINSGPILIIILGSIVFIVAFLGCFGAIRESSCCILTYSIIMLLLFLCQIALIVFVWTQHSNFTKSIQAAVKEAWDGHKSNPAVMDAIQINFKCCGYNSPADYTMKLEGIPNSCCGRSATSCSIVTVATMSGCSKAVVSFWDKNLDIIKYAGLGVAAVELVAFIFGFCLYNGIRNRVRRGRY